jgi:hypothetical protein
MKKEVHLNKKRVRSDSENSDLSQSEESLNVKTKKTNIKPKQVQSDEEDSIIVGNDEITIGLDSKKRVSIRKFKGQIYVDIREYYEKDGDKKPTKKGISLKPELWEKLKSRVQDIDNAIKNMKK